MSGGYGDSAFAARDSQEMALELEMALEDMSDDEFAQSLRAAWPEAAEPLAQYEQSQAIAPLVQVEGPSPAELSGRFAFASPSGSYAPSSGSDSAPASGFTRSSETLSAARERELSERYVAESSQDARAAEDSLASYSSGRMSTPAPVYIAHDEPPEPALPLIDDEDEDDYRGEAEIEVALVGELELDFSDDDEAELEPAREPVFEYSDPALDEPGFAASRVEEPAPVNGVGETLFHPEAMAVQTRISSEPRTPSRDELDDQERESYHQLIVSGKAHPIIERAAARLEPDAPRLRRRGGSEALAVDSEAGTLRVGDMKTIMSGEGAHSGVRRSIAPLKTRRGIPDRVDRFPIISKLGEGGMGVVYSAFDEELDRRVAIKVVRGIRSLNESARQRMLREAKAMAKLSHPNVVQVYQAGLFEQGVFVAMEFIRGQTLSEWLGLDDPPPTAASARAKSGASTGAAGRTVVTRPWREVVKMFLQPGRGLAAAHEAGLVHRDFKPDNVLVGEDGRARVLDFGLARVLDEEDEVEALGRSSLEQVREERRKETADLTKTGTIMGTPAYMSPEQHLGLPTDARTDQFSFCVSLHEGLFGERPFRSKTLMELRVQVERGKIDPPSNPRDVPASVLEVIRRGLAVDPGERYPDMHTLLAELEKTIEPPAWRRWAWPLIALLSVAVMAIAVFVAATREPTPEERSVVDELVVQANEAGAHACWVVPCAEDNLDTSYRKVLELEGLEGVVAREGDERGAALRDEFSRALIRLGDRFWEREGGRGFARDYYLQALLFKENAEALKRSALTRGEIADYREKARLGRFSEVERVAARPMQLLTIEDERERIQALLAYRDQHGEALGTRAERLDTLIVELGGPPREPTRPTPTPAPAPVLEPEPEPTPPPEPSPPPEPRPKKDPKPRKPKPAAGPSPADIEASRQLTNQGDAAKRRRQFKEAKTLYNRALDLYPRNHRALDGLCTVLFEQSDYGSAVEFCERAVGRAPGNARYHIHLGDAYYKTLRFSQARTHYLKARQLGDPKAERKLAKVRAKLGE